MTNADDAEALVVAAFARRHAAFGAAAALRSAGFTYEWLGACVTEGGVERLQALDAMERAARWIRAAGDESVREALLARGVPDLDAERIDGKVPEGHALLIARGPASAAALGADIVTAYGGTLFELLGRELSGEG